MVNKGILENTHANLHMGSRCTHIRTNMWANYQIKLMVYVTKGNTKYKYGNCSYHWLGIWHMYNIHTYMCMHDSVSVCMVVYMDVYIYIYNMYSVHACICMYAWIHMYIFIHSHIYNMSVCVGKKIWLPCKNIYDCPSTLHRHAYCVHICT